MRLKQIVDADFADAIYNYKCELDYNKSLGYVIITFDNENEAKRCLIELEEFIENNKLSIELEGTKLILE